MHLTGGIVSGRSETVSGGKNMAIKMRVLYNSGKKGMAQFANAVKEKYDLPSTLSAENFRRSTLATRSVS